MYLFIYFNFLIYYEVYLIVQADSSETADAFL